MPETQAKIDAIDDIKTLGKLVSNLTEDWRRILIWDELFASFDFPSTRKGRSR